MKVYLKILALALCACGILSLSACAEPPVETTVTTVPTTAAPTQPPLSPKEKYDLARDGVLQAGNWILDYTLEEQRGIGEDIFTKYVSGRASFSNLYQEDMVAVVEEQQTFGGYTSEYTEIYCESMAFSKVKENYFKAEMEPESFVQRQIPAVLIDSALYKSIVETAGDSGTVISFDGAKAVESWVVNSKVTLIDASGSAVLDISGGLKETSYRITYGIGDVEYTVSAKVQVTAPPSLDLGGTHQQHIRRSTQIQSLDVPKLFLQVVGTVYSANKLHCDAVESIYSEAIPLAYSQNSVIDLSGAEEEMFARAEYKSQLSDYRGNVSSSKQLDIFENGVFSSSINGGKPQENPTATALQMRRFYEDAILSALAAPKYVKDASLTVSKDSYRVEIEGNHDFLKDMMANITQFLQVDLDEKAEKKKTVAASAYLEIDRETGLPTTMGLLVERQHTIDTVAYRLVYRLDQTVEFTERE